MLHQTKTSNLLACAYSKTEGIVNRIIPLRSHAGTNQQTRNISGKSQTLQMSFYIIEQCKLIKSLAWRSSFSHTHFKTFDYAIMNIFQERKGCEIKISWRYCFKSHCRTENFVIVIFNNKKDYLNHRS